jgi:V8-like Glu-specific endopeptidase
MLDGEVQILDRKTMGMWSNSTAYFNGDTVVLEVFAGANTIGTHVKVKNLGLQMPVQPVGDPGQCGICGPDDRVQTNELWSGRIMPVGCTASVYCNTGSGMVTAGHCIDGQSNLVVHFNVPNSNPNCTTNNPPVADQFPVLPGFQFQNVSPGNDWGVYLTGTNSLGQTPFQRYGQFRPLAAAPSGVGATTNFWGYGLDTNCVRSQTQQFSTGPITAVNADYYDFSADVRGGNSGSGYLNAAGQIIGIVTHCRVNCPNVAQRIDDPAFVAARNAVNQNCAGGAPTPPANDNCGSAVAIGLGTTNGDTTQATADGAGCFAASRDVWYSFTPGCDGVYRFSTCGGASWDTTLSVYSGCPGTAGNQLACVDDSCGLQTQVDVTMTADTTYLVRVAGFSASSFGSFTLTSSVVSVAAPANDNCASAQAIGLGATSGTNRCSTTDGTGTCGFNVGLDVWYSFTPTCAGTYTFDTCGARTFDTVLGLWTGCGGTQIACVDDACGLGSRITASLAAGTTYLVRVAGYNQQSGTFDLNVTRGADTFPVNDNCASALPVTAGVPVTGSTACASNDGTANCAGSATSNDVWYAFTADCTASYSADTLGSGYDTAISVHTGCPGNLSNIVVCDDDGAGFPFSRAVWQQPAGTTYYIRVSGFNNAAGNFQMTVSNLPNDSAANPIQLVSGTVGFSNRGANTDGNPEGICLAFGDNNVNGDLWYYYFAECNGTVEINTCGSGFDTKIAVYNNYSATPPTNPIVCNDDSCGLQSRVTFNATAGQLFQIRVGGFLTGRGCGVINVSCTTPCPWQGDGCAADYNNDGSIDGDDVIAFFGDWDLNGACADATSDGSVDGDDVILFFNSWDNAGIGFPGC